MLTYAFLPKQIRLKEPTALDLISLLDHNLGGDCPVYRAQGAIQIALLPAAAVWKLNDELPRFTVALHGAAEHLGAMLPESVERSDIEAALTRLLDDVDARIAEDQVIGASPKGSAWVGQVWFS